MMYKAQNNKMTSRGEGDGMDRESLLKYDAAVKALNTITSRGEGVGRGGELILRDVSTTAVLQSATICEDIINLSHNSSINDAEACYCPYNSPASAHDTSSGSDFDINNNLSSDIEDDSGASYSVDSSVETCSLKVLTGRCDSPKSVHLPYRPSGILNSTDLDSSANCSYRRENSPYSLNSSGSASDMSLLEIRHDTSPVISYNLDIESSGSSTMSGFNPIAELNQKESRDRVIDKGAALHL